MIQTTFTFIFTKRCSLIVVYCVTRVLLVCRKTTVFIASPRRYINPVTVISCLNTEKKMSVFVPFLLPMFAHLAKYGKTAPNNNIMTRTDTLYETPIQFDCLVGSHKGARWKFNEKLLFADDNAVSNTFRGSMFLLSNYSLRITSASFRHEGIFSCLKNSTALAVYDLNILGMYKQRHRKRIIT